MTTVDKIKDAFPHPTIEQIVGQPGYETIKPMHQHLNANAASINSHLGNGRLGLLYLTVQPAVFNTLSNIPFIPPTNPDPIIPYPPPLQLSTKSEPSTLPMPPPLVSSNSMTPPIAPSNSNFWGQSMTCSSVHCPTHMSDMQT